MNADQERREVIEVLKEHGIEVTESGWPNMICCRMTVDVATQLAYTLTAVDEAEEATRSH